MSKPSSLREVAANSKLILNFCPGILEAVVFGLLSFTSHLSAKESEDITISIPSTITTLDERSFSECQLVRAEPDALLIRHNNGMARLSFSILDETLKEQFHYDPNKAFRAATARYEKERALLYWRYREEEAFRLLQNQENRMAKIKSFWIPVEATVIQSNEKGIYVAARRIQWDHSCPHRSKKILKPFGPNCLFLPEKSKKLRPGSLWKGYICPSPDDTVLDLDGEMFTVPFHQALTVDFKNTGGT